MRHRLTVATALLLLATPFLLLALLAYSKGALP